MSTYTAIDITKPNASTQSIAAMGASTNANDVALWYAVVQGGSAPGFVFNTSGGTTEEPQFYLWTNGAQIVRATNTWTGGYLSQQLWQVSQDTGSTYASVCTQTFTYDGGTGALTATTAAGGMSNIYNYAVGKLKALLATVAAHAAATGAAVHGLGTMSTQAASAVAIGGGSALLTYERESTVALGNVAGSTTVNWQGGGLYTLTVTNAAGALTWQNLPGTDRVGYLTLDVTNGGIATNLLGTYHKAGGVAVSWTNPGRDIATLMCHNSGAVTVVGFVKDAKA